MTFAGDWMQEYIEEKVSVSEPVRRLYEASGSVDFKRDALPVLQQYSSKQSNAALQSFRPPLFRVQRL